MEVLTPHTGYQPMHWHYIIKVAICKYFAQIPINDKGRLEVKTYLCNSAAYLHISQPSNQIASIKIVICKQHYIPTHIKTKYILSKVLPPQKPRFQNKFPTPIYHTRPPLVIANIAPSLFTLPAPPVIANWHGNTRISPTTVQQIRHVPHNTSLRTH